MKKVIDFIVITTSVAGITFAGNAIALQQSANQLTQTHYQNNSITHLRADRNSRKQKLVEKLGLEPFQQDQIRAIRSQYRPQMKSLREDIREQRQKLAQMMQNNNSESALRSQHNRIIGLRQDIQELRFEVMLKTREVLTQEQRQKWAELMQERRANRRARYQ